MEQRATIKFCVKFERNASEKWEMYKIAFDDEYLSRTKIFVWHKRFKRSQKSVEDDDCSGFPSTSRLKIQRRRNSAVTTARFYLE